MSPPYKTLTYTLPIWLSKNIWKPGLRIVVLLNKSMLRSGIILSLSSEKESSVPNNILIQPILWPLEKTPFFSPEYIQMIQQLALRQAVPPGKILANVLPVGLKTTQVQLRIIENNIPTYISLKDIKNKSLDERKELGSYWTNDMMDCLAYKEDIALSELCVLNKKPPWNIRPSANRQQRILNFLFKHGPTSRRSLLKNLGRELNTVIHKLILAGFISLTNDYGEDEDPYIKILPPIKKERYINFSLEQENAIKTITKSLNNKNCNVFLLFGITGSGKTAVYIETIKACLKLGKTALILAPEVALGFKLKQDIIEALPDIPYILFHGYQSSSQKEKTFRTITTTDKPLIIIGTRSALFLPINNLGAIILDEEHDTSFKQDDRLIYQAKDIAWFLANQYKIPLILGSATPDIKTFYAMNQSKITAIHLPNRVGNSELPQIKLIDIKNNTSKNTVFSFESLEVLKNTLGKGEQAIILLNRRGYAPIMYCIQCGTTMCCPDCAISLTYHKQREGLICHYCGYILPFPSPCSSCQSIHFYPIGCGTEQIEEELSTLLPYEKILRFDHDSTRIQGETEKILTAFAKNEAQILVGTQMLSKGHHFPNVTLVVVANGDLGLNIPDYRAAEKTFQLLIQSAGRAGRGEKPGTVLIQTNNLSHYCWEYIQEHNYIGFYEHEIALRKKWKYPPFTCLALLRLSYPIKWIDGPTWLEKIQKTIDKYSKLTQVSIRGPALSPIAIIKNRKRFQWLLKGEYWQDVRDIFSQIQVLTLPKQIRFSIDIDPIDML